MNAQTWDSLLPFGLLATRRWLLGQGVSVHRLDNAVKSQKLLPLTAGVYAQYSTAIPWEGVVASVQKMASVPVHVGGVSALELLGLAQYLRFSPKPVVGLYSTEKLPNWLARINHSAVFEFHSTTLLWPGELMDNDQYVKQHTWQEALPPLVFSCPEKAILEALVDVPRRISFEHAEQLVQGLVNLSPRKMDALLKCCKHIRVKRLFLWLAQRQNYAWFKYLDKASYDLGTGKRVIAEDGMLDNDYLITVPKEMCE